MIEVHVSECVNMQGMSRDRQWMQYQQFIKWNDHSDVNTTRMVLTCHYIMMSKALIDMSHMDMCNMKSLVNVRLASNADTKMNDISHRLKYCQSQNYVVSKYSKKK